MLIKKESWNQKHNHNNKEKQNKKYENNYEENKKNLKDLKDSVAFKNDMEQAEHKLKNQINQLEKQLLQQSSQQQINQLFQTNHQEFYTTKLFQNFVKDPTQSNEQFIKFFESINFSEYTKEKKKDS